MSWVCLDCKRRFSDDELVMIWDGAYPEEERYITECPYCWSEDVEEDWGQYDDDDSFCDD